MKTLIKSDKILTLDTQDTIHAPGYLLVEDDRILELGPAHQAPNVDETVELGAKLVMPGLVNAHTHSPMSLFRGISEGASLFTMEGWYNTIRVVEEVMDPGMIAPGVALSCAEMIRTGTTTFVDQYFWAEQIAPAVRRIGMRAAIAYGIVELGQAEARERELAAASAFLESLQGDPLITGWVGPHAFFVDNSPEAIKMELALADQYNTGLHFHLATDDSEDRYCMEHYGRSAVQQMKVDCILDHRLIAAHGIAIPQKEFPTLAEHPITIVVAASSALRNATGFAPVKAMHDAGIKLALGTDNVTNNNSYDMFKEMQILGKMATYQELTPNAIPTRDILDMATMGGARALGMEDEIGSLETGKKADWIALDLDEIGWAPQAAQDVYTALVYSITGQHVRDVMINGRWVYRDDTWTTVDYHQARTELEETYLELQQRIRN